MLAHHPITGKPIRILQTDASISKDSKTLVYTEERSTIEYKFDTISDCVKADYRIMFSDNLTMDEIMSVSQESKLLLLSTKTIDRIGLETFRESKVQNLICLEEMEQLYPHLGGAWDGTVEDAVCLLAGLLRYRYVSGIQESKRGIALTNTPPMKLWWVTQLYKPTKAKRRREIEAAFIQNTKSKLIDKIILLNEEKLDYKDEKVEEHIINHRITYADVLEIGKKAPEDVILAFANADIGIDDKTWRNLWSVSLENTFLALLRYEVPESGNLEESTLFGPRSDSQDTWVVRAKDIQTNIKSFDPFNIPFGKAGCDNAIAVQFLRNRFLVVNPAMSLKTYHYHTSGVRGYNPQDVIDQPTYMYIHPTGFHDMTPKLKFSKEEIISAPISPLFRRVRGDDGEAWTQRMNKTLETGEVGWKYTGENQVQPKEEPIVYLKNCFSTNDGLVYTNKELYIGPGVEAQKVWAKQGIHGMSPTVSAEKMLFAPWKEEYGEKREEFLIKYLSKVLRIREACNTENTQILCPENKKLLECLECFNLEGGGPFIRREEDMQIWAKEGWMVPVSEQAYPLQEDMEALRKRCKGWMEKIHEGGDLRIVLVDDGSKVIQEIEDVLVHAWDVKVIYPGKTSVERMWDVMRGAWGIVCSKGGYEGCGWNWLLPRGAFVFEIDSKSTTGIEISSACGLEHRFVKKNMDSVLDSIYEEEKEWKATESEDSSDLPLIYMPKRDLEGYFGHPGDSFREMVRLWRKRGYCRVKEHPSATMVWWGNVGSKGTLLYDRPNHDWRLAAPLEEREWKKGLFGNPKPIGDNAKPWFFWPRRPEYVEELVEKGIRGWEDRKKRCVFYGKIENKVQEKRRTTMDWKTGFTDTRDEWFMVTNASEAYPFTQKEYLENLGNARYGLCLAGYGKKCHREIECMAMGCVPLVADDCDMEFYANPPVEGVHYIRVNKPEDIDRIILTQTQEEWERISIACQKWWKENCSCEGSFLLTKKLIEQEE